MTYIKKLSMHGFKSFAPKTEVHFDRGINVVVGPNGSGKCLTGDSLVQLAEGSLQRIDDLVNSRLESAVKTEDGFLMPGDGTKIMCLDMNSLKITQKPIKAFVKRTSPSKLLHIKTRSGREVTSTKYHPFFILKDGKVTAAKAEELKAGVKIATPNLEVIHQKNSSTNSDIFWDELEHVEEIKGTDWVYDLTVEEHHNFIANNIFAHNSNISDALCFVLGRLSIKSMRAAKAKNLLFMGSKYAKPAKEAAVEIVFDNSNNTFNLPVNEVSLERVVRNNGQSIYKINKETKTRAEVLETLAQAGIDPHGFNLVLQGQIQSIVRMPTEDRRKIIEEVAGISIYESRKEKSLRELEKTELRLKEISTILRERTAFLKNLEKERSQALRYKEFEQNIRRCKASIITRRIQDKEKEIQATQNSMESKITQKEQIKKKAEDNQNLIDELNEKAHKINKHIQHSTGLEQDSLRNQISNLKAEIEGLRVRKENFENRKLEFQRRIEEMSKSIPEHEAEISELRKESPLISKKQEELKKRKEELKQLEEEKKKAYSLKTEFNSLKERLKDKELQLERSRSQSDSLLKQIEEYTSNIENETKDSCEKKIISLKKLLETNRQNLKSLTDKEFELHRLQSSANTNIESAKEVKSKVQSIDTCPLCLNKMTEEHLSHVISSSDEKISEAQTLLEKISKELSEISLKKHESESEIENLTIKLSLLDKEISLHERIIEKKSQIRALLESEELLKAEITTLETKKDVLQNQTSDISRIDEKYSAKMLEIEEISARTSQDLDKTLMYKERELERIKEVIKLSKRDLSEIQEEISEISVNIESKSSLLETREAENQALNEKYKQMFEERDSIQEQSQQKSHDLVIMQSEWRQIEEQINYLKIGNAKLSAEKEALEMELQEFSGAEIIKGTLEFLQDRLRKSQEAISQIGPINMRALEVYEGVKEEYDKVYEKVQTLENEKNEILKIIEEIDKKKKRTFMKTFKGINELFRSNFSRLFTKGQAFLELEDKEDIFNGGVNIVVKFAKGKHFDVTSLSGGEQTLIAVSLLFAIQEFRPYHFYILDEIDAALDKRNSERLSGLLRKYMQQGQYIVVTHNDALIMESDRLYGISMHDGISKVLGLKLD